MEIFDERSRENSQTMKKQSSQKAIPNKPQIFFEKVPQTKPGTRWSRYIPVPTNSEDVEGLNAKALVTDYKTPHTALDQKQPSAFIDAKKTLARGNHSNNASPKSRPKKPRAETTPLQPKKHVASPSRESI